MLPFQSRSLSLRSHEALNPALRLFPTSFSSRRSFVHSLLLSHLFKEHYTFALRALPAIGRCFSSYGIRLGPSFVNPCFWLLPRSLKIWPYIPFCLESLLPARGCYHHSDTDSVVLSYGFSGLLNHTKNSSAATWRVTLFCGLALAYFFLSLCPFHSSYYNFIPAHSCLNRQPLLQCPTHCESCNGFA